MKRVLFLLFSVFIASLPASSATVEVGPIVSNVVTVLPDQASIPVDASTAYAFSLTIGGDRALESPTSQVKGSLYSLAVTQDGTGSRLLTYGTSYRFPSATPPTLSTAAGALDVMLFYSDGTYFNYLSITKAIESPLTPPTNLVATPGATNCVLTWDDNSGDETAFEVWADYSASGAAWGIIATLSANIETLDDTGLDPGTFWYRVRAKRGTSYSAYTDTAICVVP